MRMFCIKKNSLIGTKLGGLMGCLIKQAKIVQLLQVLIEVNLRGAHGSRQTGLCYVTVLLWAGFGPNFLSIIKRAWGLAYAS